MICVHPVIPQYSNPELHALFLIVHSLVQLQYSQANAEQRCFLFKGDFSSIFKAYRRCAESVVQRGSNGRKC